MSKNQLPPLASVRCFEAAARHLSFTRAAEELGMTQAAVSYQIRLLEERVGAGLFRRGPRGVALTDAGARLAPRVAEAFAGLRSAFEDLSDAVSGTLTVDAIATFAANWLAPRLGGFQLAHPDLAVRLISLPHLVDFAREEVDVAIRSGRGEWPGLVAHRLMDVEFTPMVSPRLLARTPVSRPEDLLGLPLIDPDDPWWAAWFSAAGVDHRGQLSGGISVESQALAGRAAAAGHGAAILTPAFFRDELADGLLVRPFETVGTEDRAYWLVYPEARRRSARIRAFRDWMLDAVAAEPAPAL